MGLTTSVEKLNYWSLGTLQTMTFNYVNKDIKGVFLCYSDVKFTSHPKYSVTSKITYKLLVYNTITQNMLLFNEDYNPILGYIHHEKLDCGVMKNDLVSYFNYNGSPLKSDKIIESFGTILSNIEKKPLYYKYKPIPIVTVTPVTPVPPVPTVQSYPSAPGGPVPPVPPVPIVTVTTVQSYPSAPGGPQNYNDNYTLFKLINKF